MSYNSERYKDIVDIVTPDPSGDGGLLINGVQNSSLSNGSATEQPSGSSIFNIGALRNGTFQFQGKLAHVAMYKHKLSVDQLVSHYEAGKYGW